VWHKEGSQPGKYGTVCNDGFDDADARVVCKQLGLGTGNTGKAIMSASRFGVVGGTVPIWLTRVACTPAIARIEDCRHNTNAAPYPWGTTGCKHSQDVAVECP
jgi:deleted-in-malignant-brain-tumors protein 1